MAVASTRYAAAAAVADGVQAAHDLPDALGAFNVHDKEDTLETSEKHGMEHSLGNKQPNTTEDNTVEEGHDAEKAMHAVLNTVSLRLIRISSKTSLTPR
jgi:hypothetical protein